jgi:putative hydrolase of the HAD superfamily
MRRKRRAFDQLLGASLESHSSLSLVGFDADDTLWHSEIHFRAAHDEFECIVGQYIDLADAGLHDRMLATERRNIKLFGYGAKGMCLSMIETAIALTDERISAADVHRLLDLGKGILGHPVELLPGVREAVLAAAEIAPLVLITKGALFHQEDKIRRSGLAELFPRIEIVSEKDTDTYARVLAECGVEPARFAMVGNSLRSDIEPVLKLGGAGVHVPYAVTWALEAEHAVDPEHPRLRTASSAADVPPALLELAAR